MVDRALAATLSAVDALQDPVDSVVHPRVSSPQDDPILEPGTTIGGRFVVDGLLGRGGMGSVYLARHRVIDKEVAIKVLSLESMRQAQTVERFELEARLVSEIDSPHVVEVFDVGRLDSGQLYYVMEYLSGETLDELIERRGALPLELVLEISAQLIEGLAATHAAGTIHRDLKSENVLVSGCDETLNCKLVDFGIAKEVERASGPKLTMVGDVLGTPYYMSPEQACGLPIDPRTDVYSLGVLLYEMVSATLPFDGDDVFEVLRGHMMVPPPPLSLRAPWCPQGLADLVHRCLQKDPRDRYASIEALGTDLTLLRRNMLSVHTQVPPTRGFDLDAAPDTLCSVVKEGAKGIDSSEREGANVGPRHLTGIALASASVAFAFVLALALAGAFDAGSSQPAQSGASRPVAASRISFGWLRDLARRAVAPRARASAMSSAASPPSAGSARPEAEEVPVEATPKPRATAAKRRRRREIVDPWGD